MSITRPLIVLLTLMALTLSVWAEESQAPKDEKPEAKSQAVEKVDAKADVKSDAVDAEMKLITSVVQVLDRRSSIDSILNHCTVELLFIGKPLEQVIGVDHIDLTEAFDDAGHDLIDRKTQPNRELGQDDLLRNSGKQPANSAGMSINLKNPPRASKQIKSLRGIASFVLKSVEGKDYVSLSDFLEETGKPIASDALKTRGVELVYLPALWIKQWATDKANAKSQLLPADEMAGLLPLIEGVSQQSGTVTLIPLLITDPQKQLAQVQITTPRGNLRKIQFEHVTVFVSLTGAPTQPTLEVNLKSEQTMMKLPFEITEIPLP
jgi:hypothetical protein